MRSDAILSTYSNIWLSGTTITTISSSLSTGFLSLKLDKMRQNIAWLSYEVQLINNQVIQWNFISTIFSTKINRRRNMNNKVPDLFGKGWLAKLPIMLKRISIGRSTLPGKSKSGIFPAVF